MWLSVDGQMSFVTPHKDAEHVNSKYNIIVNKLCVGGFIIIMGLSIVYTSISNK